MHTRYVSKGLCAFAPLLLSILAVSCDSTPPAERQAYDGLTPIHRAAAAGDATALEKLLYEQEANPDVRDADGVAPIHRAARDNHLEVVQVLIAYGADPLIKTPSGWSPIQLAVREGHLDMITFLSQYAFDPNGAMPDGERYLAFAQRSGSGDLFAYLLRLEADVNITTRDDITLLAFAFGESDKDRVHVLLDHDARVPKPISAKVLEQAIEWNDRVLLRKLIKAGADPAATDDQGRTPKDFAREEGNEFLVQVLEEYEDVSGAEPSGRN